LTACADTQKSSWVFVDATVFAVYAGLSEDIWSQTVSGFLDYSVGEPGRIESAFLGSSPSRSFLKIDLTPTIPENSRGPLLRKVPLSDFRNGYVTGLLLSFPVVEALMKDAGAPGKLTPRKSQLSHEQALGLDRLLVAAECHLRHLRGNAARSLPQRSPACV
jgi:hypothetical protein